MSAAVATRSQQQNPVPSSTGSSSSASRMGTSSPADKKKSQAKTEDPQNRDSSNQSGQAAGKTSPPRTDPTSNVKPPSDQASTQDTTTTTTTTAASTTDAETTKPLAPPPRPAQANSTNAAETADYFSGVHNGSHFSLEPNPFEQSFSNPAADTPGKSLLPPVASLTSPASLLRDGAASAGFNWPNSLRSGPLSPAMLTGPTGATDYFDGHIRGGFPTPNESSLRTGLTPGGGGTMFPAPSPNSQALFNQLASAGVTPGTLDFHRTAMNAARKTDAAFGGPVPAAGAGQTDPSTGADVKTEAPHQQQTQPAAAAGAPPAGAPRTAADPFGQHDANDAANGLFLLAQARNGPAGPAQVGQPNAATMATRGTTTTTAGTSSQQTSPNMGKPVGRGSLGGSISGSARAPSEMSVDSMEETKPATRNKGKKGGSTGKSTQASNGRRKAAEETPSKAPASKKAKANSGNSISAMPDFTQDSEEELDMNKEMLNEHGKKMTDEEKRKNFLERNRVAALKCRQRKKQWLANLQAKVEIFSSENDALSAQVTQLREEIVNLKTLLLAHKDCPVSQAQGMGGMGMAPMAPEFNHHANPYGMAMTNTGQVMAQPGMQRR